MVKSARSAVNSGGPALNSQDRFVEICPADVKPGAYCSRARGVRMRLSAIAYGSMEADISHTSSQVARDV
jgi:hypothetical protein